MTLHDTLSDTAADTPVDKPLTEVPHRLAGPPEVSQAEAARICKVSTATIRRHRAELQKHGAHPDPAGGWLIPIPALVAARLLDRTTPPDTHAGNGLSPDTTPRHHPLVSPRDAETAALRDELAAAEQRFRAVEHRAELAEAIAEERGRALEVERLALRMLTQAPHQPSPRTAPTPAAAEPVPEPVPEARVGRPGDHQVGKQGPGRERPSPWRGWLLRRR